LRNTAIATSSPGTNRTWFHTFDVPRAHVALEGELDRVPRTGEPTDGRSALARRARARRRAVDARVGDRAARDPARDRRDCARPRGADPAPGAASVTGSRWWIEIVNSGSTPVDVGGWKVADRDKDTGEPTLDEAATIPSGTTLAAKAYGLIRGGGLEAGKECPEGGQAFCIDAEFGTSNSNGETIYLVAANGDVVGAAVYPPNAADGEDTWGRIPSGDPDGAFRLNKATPGAENEAK